MLAVIAAVGLVSAGAARADIIIDYFDAGSAAVTIDSSATTDTDTDTALANAIGGERELYANTVQPLSGLTGADEVTGAVGSGVLSVSASLLETVGVVSADLSAQYGTAMGGAELNSDWTGMTAIRISFADAPTAAVGLWTEVFWNGGNTSHTVEVATGTGTVDLALADFSGLAANIDNVDGVRVTFQFGEDDDVSLSVEEITVIPEPGTMWLLGLGSLALLRRKRK